MTEDVTAPDALTPVLLFHDVVRGTPHDVWTVSRDDLARHLDAVVESNRTVLAPTELARHQPPGGCAVTFDDGFASFADLALPLLEERGLAAGLYLTTGLVDRPGMLSRTAVADLAGVARVELGGHAVRHVHLDVLPLARAAAEINGSHAELAAITGVAPTSFAYPHGSHTPRVRDAVRDSAYTNAYAVKNAFTHPADDPYALARLTVRADTDPAQVRDWLAGVGAPRAWQRQRLRTVGYRQVRRVRHLGERLRGTAAR